MSLAGDLQIEVSKIFKTQWNVRDGKVVPESANLSLGNEGVKLDATVLYADLDGSTNLVDQYIPDFAAEIYKTYLHCTAKIIRLEGGVITAYDGDRVMAVFIGNAKNTNAARCGLKINYAVSNIINPLITELYPKSSFRVRQVVGIDSSELMATRTGIRGANDLVWVGRAANYAAKLCSLPSEFPTRITKTVYDSLHNSLRTHEGLPFWEPVTWTNMNNMDIYRSTGWWHTDYVKRDPPLLLSR